MPLENPWGSPGNIDNGEIAKTAIHDQLVKFRQNLEQNIYVNLEDKDACMGVISELENELPDLDIGPMHRSSAHDWVIHQITSRLRDSVEDKERVSQLVQLLSFHASEASGALSRLRSLGSGR